VLLLLALYTAMTAARLALCTMTLNQMAALVIVMGSFNAGILPSPERKVQKSSHQTQISKQNKAKGEAIHAQAHACATTLVANERANPR
jgi:hypothetical protein